MTDKRQYRQTRTATLTTQRIRLPPNTTRVQARGLTSLMMRYPNGTIVAPGANVILIETYNNQRSSELKHPQARLKELDALRTTILNVFLRN